MSFVSKEFLIFAVVFFSLWPLIARFQTIRWGWISLASFFFYAWWDWRFLPLMVATGLIDFFAALAIVRFQSHRRGVLAFSLICNLGALIFFKYSFFLASIAKPLFFLLPGHLVLPNFSIILPAGISFYTFHSISYTIDVYRRKIVPTRSALHFFAYLSMFSQLVAGPIVRGASLLPQLTTWDKPTLKMVWQGFSLIVMGFFKKTVLADHFAPLVEEAFTGKVAGPGFYWWIIVTLFAAQIYFDFSGYTDIARGLTKCMGYELPLNFDHPYTSSSFHEFWTRWHISLSSWFRDYLYIPLGGSKLGEWKTYRNLWITFLISGFWHGANWTFIVWGGVHAALVSIERWGNGFELGSVLKRLKIQRLVFIVFLLMSWVFFRAESLSQAMAILGRMIHVFPIRFEWLGEIGWAPLGLLGIGLAYEVGGRSSLQQKIQLYPAGPLLEVVWTCLILVACLFYRGQGTAFIYFQF